jgi:transmembrane sensor
MEQAWCLMDRPRAAGRAAEMAGALRARESVRRRRRSGIAVAAMIALIFTGSIWESRRPPEVLPPVLKSSSAIVHQPQKQTLPDGTLVELKTGAELEAHFTSPLRRVVLRRGEALFHVAKDPDRPFVVSAGEVEVRAIGTAFTVFIADSGVEVVVTEGQVAVENPPAAPDEGSERAPASSSPAFSALLAAGERINVGLAPDAAPPEVVAISSDEIADRLAWRATRIEFSETPLAEALALMNQHSALRLVVEDAELARLRVNGLFRADNTETLIRLLEASFDVRTERSGNAILLRRGPSTPRATPP